MNPFYEPDSKGFENTNGEINCPSCGTRGKASDNFCRKCGIKLLAEVTPGIDYTDFKQPQELQKDEVIRKVAAIMAQHPEFQFINGPGQVYSNRDKINLLCVRSGKEPIFQGTIDDINKAHCISNAIFKARYLPGAYNHRLGPLGGY